MTRIRAIPEWERRAREVMAAERSAGAAERQATAWERMATAMEKQVAMDEQMMKPTRVRVDGQAQKAPTVLTTPAPTIPKREERVEPGGLDDDEIEPLSDKS